MSGFWDWVGRVIMLSLAGMITLSIIGAIAAIPSGSLPPTVRFEQERPPVPQQVEEPQPAPQPQGKEALPPEEARQAPRAPLPVVPAAVERVDAADWLETIAYALLALVGLAALAILLLWRALIQWRRSADALEALANRPR